MFEAEAQKIKDIFGDELVDIHHIGSTSVPGLQAKPIIDIMPVVKDIDKIDSFNKQMEGLGYESMGEFGMKGRRYFRKGGDDRTHQVHVFQVDNKEDIHRHLAVRDYLRTHDEEMKKYGALKKTLPNNSRRTLKLIWTVKTRLFKSWNEKRCAGTKRASQRR